MGNVMLPSLVGACDADCDPKARIHHRVRVPLSSDGAVEHGPEVMQMFHGASAGCGRHVRVSCDVQMFAN